MVTAVCILVSQVRAASLNEWTFEKDMSGLTLSQAANSGTEHAVFSAGGDGFLLTDGQGLLVCTHAGSDINGMWSDGAILDADVNDIPSGSHYLRCDLNYDLSSAGRIADFAFGLSIIDSSGTNVAGIILAPVSDSNAPVGKAMAPVASDLAWSGQISVIVKVDIDTQILTAWYDLTGANNFDETRPSITNIPVSLTSMDKLRFQATGDIRPAGSTDYAAAENIRTASSWDDIVLPASIALSVNPLFCDHMVLQRDRNVPVWGHITPGATVTLSLDGTVTGTAMADANGVWIAELVAHAQDGGIAHTLSISSEGEADIQIEDVVFGDVYLASGQSNMDRSIYSTGIPGQEDERAESAAYSLIRQIAITRTNSVAAWDQPLIRSAWTPCSPDTFLIFSATAYFFAKDVYLKTGVPVGIICSTWGGQSINRFLSPEGVAMVPELSGVRQCQEQGEITDLYDIYNAMIAPLIPYGIRGAIWYQGEHNANEGDIYRSKMLALIRGWRRSWGQGAFPFYYVQLPNLITPNDWSGLRAAQFKALSETNTGMAVTIDVGDDGNIHPSNKQDVGRRLAQWALAKDLDYPLTYSGPLYHQAVIEGSQIRVLFDYADDGLLIGQKDSTNPVTVVEGPLENFEVAGADRVFVSASAVIDRDSVIVSNAAVTSPVCVQYCYASSPSGSNKLYNAAGLPAAPFRADGLYYLDVKSGSGTATGLVAGTHVAITAAAPVLGKVFDRWIGAAGEVANLNASTTTVTMPSNSLYLLATYRSTNETVYTLIVNNGYGSGTSQTNSILNLQAAVPAAGQVFDHWSGDTQTVENAYAVSTTLRMPASNVSVTAVYRTVDSVGDGVPDIWRASYFGGSGSTTNSDSSSDADPDGDGVSNRQEYLAGTSPVDAQSVFKLSGSLSNGRELAIGFQGLFGHRYRLEKTSSLTEPSWETVLFNITGDGTEKDFMLTAAETNGFYRVRAE